MAGSRENPTRRRAPRLRVLALSALVAGALAGLAAEPASASPFKGNGMWIWYLSRSEGGNLDKIARKAHRHHMRTVYIKAADGSGNWSQFTHKLVAGLHNRGLKVCAWQFVYGAHPTAEANRGGDAEDDGADCLVIDAEGQYEGKYAEADKYVDKLRREVGGGFPVGLAGFPYVDYHPSFPYSVFLGKHGADYNLPQLYWHTIGVSVREGYEHTFRYNRVYDKPIFPLGQTYSSPPIKDIQRFRRYALNFGFRGVSWWDWQETNGKEWDALRKRVDEPIKGYDKPAGSFPVLSKGSAGDLVLWAQEHLRGAGLKCPVSGKYGAKTVRAVKRFQRTHGLNDDGVIGATTWRKLLKEHPKSIDWSSRSSAPKIGSSAPAEPRSATLPATRYEIPPTPPMG
jgi:hypothetical protein